MKLYIMVLRVKDEPKVKVLCVNKVGELVC